MYLLFTKVQYILKSQFNNIAFILKEENQLIKLNFNILKEVF